MRTVLQATLPLVDPHDATDAADALTVIGAIHAPLVRRTGPGAFTPAVAASWTVAPDARRWRFRLREGLAFHDGAPLDAGAVVWSLQRMTAPGIGATLGAPAVWAPYLGGAEIAAQDAHTVAVTLPEPMADLLDVLCCAAILKPDASDHRLIGAGPFAVADFEPGALTLRSPGGPLRLAALPDAAGRAAALAVGEAFAATRLPHGATVPGATLTTQDDPTMIVWLFHCDRPAVADPRVRRALNLALDRAALAAAAGVAASPQHGALSPAHMGYRDEPTPADPAAARRLLAEAGHGAGLTLAVDIPDRLPDEAEALTAALAAQLAAVGVALDVTVHRDRVAYAERVRASAVGDLCLFDSSPVSAWRTQREKLDSRVRGAWWLGYRNPALEALLDRARVETNASARAALYAACGETLRADPPWLTAYRHRRTAGVRGDRPGWRLPDDGVMDLATLPG